MVTFSDAEIEALKAARRVIIVGNSGAGKSTLSRALAPLLNLPLVHLDQIYWLPGWQPRSEQEWRSILERELDKECWILEGNYASTLDLRLRAAEVAIWIETATWFSLYRVFRRVVTTYGKVRADSAPGCPERFDWDFIKYVWRFNRDYTPRLAAPLGDPPPGKTVLRLRGARAVRALLAALSRG